MRKLLLALILMSISPMAFATDNIVKVTPMQEISTCKKNKLTEGDEVQFKITEGFGTFKSGEYITGTVLSIEPNGFAGKEAQVVISQFRTDKQPLYGEIYLHGNTHKVLNEFVEGNMSTFFPLFRGGEVIVKPNEQEFILHTKEIK